MNAVGTASVVRTPHAVVDVALPYIGSLLVDPSSRESIVGIARHLPPRFDWFAVECRLVANDARVDFAAVLGSRLDARELIEGSSSDVLPSTILPFVPLLTEWATGDSILRETVVLVTLEFDVLQDGVAVFAYICLDPTVGGRRAMSKAAVREVVSGVGRSMSLLWGSANDKHLAQLERVLRRVEGWGRLVHIGGRNPATNSACIAVPRHRVRELLDFAEWPGPAAELACMLELIPPRQSEVLVQLAFEDGICPSLGVEVYIDARAASAWRRFIASLVHAGLSTEGKADDLIRWLGDSQVQLPGSSWRTLLHRGINMKLSLSSNGHLQAKAYLGFNARYATF